MGGRSTAGARWSPAAPTPGTLGCPLHGTMRAFGLAVIGMLALTMPARAQSTAAAFSGNGLIVACHRFAEADPGANLDALQQGACAGIVWAAWLFSVRDGVVCSPKGTTVFQVARATVRYMDQHSAYLDRDLTVLVRSALIDAWPCASTKPRAEPPRPETPETDKPRLKANTHQRAEGDHQLKPAPWRQARLTARDEGAGPS